MTTVLSTKYGRDSHGLIFESNLRSKLAGNLSTVIRCRSRDQTWMTATRQATPGELQPQFACLEGNEWKVAHQHVNQFSSPQQSTTDRRWMPLQLYTYFRSSATRRRSVSQSSCIRSGPLPYPFFSLQVVSPRKTCRLPPLSGAPPY
ncbi:hypothetical protein ASPFODRAFT_683980 [Aspergillus luchuensis CBS 106.47]|uniref:Uncharacterized protein n=1 Tax=Aspergillus luchuensis (strain CBS 106.47) TaxID=1137211 RepID=A0A1M3TCS4_ASPLC|nr:hypothetical protein ASPFODRAFT_683980 [Aspergillus luchuensis CBS 106.47]